MSYEVYREGEPLELGTYFVLQDTDLLGSQALFGYAHLLQSALELDSLPNKIVFKSADQRQQYETLVDFLAQLATLWQTRPKT
jgi:hypothetical protein